MRLLVGQLAQRPYAGEVFAFKSLATFVLMTAPSYQEAAGHDEVGIGYDPGSGLFAVGYCEWVSPTRNPRHRVAASRSCEVAQVAEVVDRYVLRLLLVRRSRV
ncbi:hypothetical protein AYO44_09140 [Planctomycetaceae bacterium SCGC AG-212-F19]|nr:hypothetical protein AYO44_09140 [Planctomycetaceae bacterium SCGC AG-212-F19]